MTNHPAFLQYVGLLDTGVLADQRGGQLSSGCQTIGRALNSLAFVEYDATVYIDALPKKLERATGVIIRLTGARVKKVRGIAKDENDSLIRLADFACGWVRSAQGDMQELLDWAVKTGAWVALD